MNPARIPKEDFTYRPEQVRANEVQMKTVYKTSILWPFRKFWSLSVDKWQIKSKISVTSITIWGTR